MSRSVKFPSIKNSEIDPELEKVLLVLNNYFTSILNSDAVMFKSVVSANTREINIGNSNKVLFSNLAEKIRMVMVMWMEYILFMPALMKVKAVMTMTSGIMPGPSLRLI